MNSGKVQELSLIAAPYIVLLVLALLAVALPRWMGDLATPAWTALRWLVRIVVLVGTLWAWRWHTREPRPMWAYAWLGFAVYEVVAILLFAAVRLVERFGQNSDIVFLLVFPLMIAAFVPEAVVALWVALRSPIRAAYTVFPHAAATIPLFLLGGIIPFGAGGRSATIAAVPPLIVAAIAAVLYTHIPQNRRWPYLFGAVVISQVAYAIGLASTEAAPLWVTPFLVGLGIFILAVPAILFTLDLLFLQAAHRFGWDDSVPPVLIPADQQASTTRISEYTTDESISERSGGGTMAEVNGQTSDSRVSEQTPPREPVAPPPSGPSTLDRLYKGSVVVLTVLILLTVGLIIARSAVYKVHEYERGLHLRGGRFIGVQEPGWHMQIPLVDTVMIVTTNERLGYVEQIPAMTSDDVTMIVSLQYTYKVDDPEQYALQVDDPERIVFEFVQGKLRDVVNTKEMSDVMNNRAIMNQEVMEALKAKEEQYGVEFVTVQMQNASPPEEVLTAIKDRMVALQRQEQAQAEAAQRQTVADADLYAAEKEADAEAYQITTTAKADAERIRLTAAADKEAVNALLTELEGKGAVGEKFIEYLIAQELKENSKWVIGGGEGTPILDMR